VRNRVKRRLRAITASWVAAVPPGVDLVVRVNPAAAGASSDELRSALEPLWQKVIGRVGVSA
jgi:ribonuclease P protein component